jgi:hypothetical protein
MSTNSWNYIHVVTSYISYISLILYFGIEYYGMDFDNILDSKRNKLILQIFMIGLGVLSIVAWEMSDYKKQLYKIEN